MNIGAPTAQKPSSVLQGRRVFLTGHTGFTGSWLALWLHQIGCEVTGFALEPETAPNLFTTINGTVRLVRSHIGDIRDADVVRSALSAAKPEIVLHLAAQPLVRRSYANPLETFSTNVLGTANVLEAARNTQSVRAFVSVTTDKVYENDERPHAYRETDRLGGKDPYSASKACAELVTRCYQETMAGLANGMRIAAARGGNIIGGGDWSEDRIVPDYYRAATGGRPLKIRSPDAIRPWQHVLSACHGYLLIASRLLSGEGEAAESWNIGPSDGVSLTVRGLVELLRTHSTPAIVQFESSALKEAQLLALDISKAKALLGFAPPWTTEETVMRTASWYRQYYDDPRLALTATEADLRDYRQAVGDLA